MSKAISSSDSNKQGSEAGLNEQEFAKQSAAISGQWGSLPGNVVELIKASRRYGFGAMGS